MPSNLPLNVAVLLFPGVDILDFSGPIEIYSTLPAPAPPSSPPPTTTSPPPSPHFTISTFSHATPLPSSHPSLTYIPTHTFATVSQNLEAYDILLLPGAHPSVLIPLLSSSEGTEIVQLVRRFANLPPRSGGEQGGRREKEKVLHSVCTGALFLAAADLLTNRRATTHHLALPLLQELADKAAAARDASASQPSNTSGIEIVRERWVDAGVTEAGVRIIMAGGVSSGIDSALAVVEMCVGRQEAEWVGEIVEFERRGEGWGSDEGRKGEKGLSARAGE